MGYTHYWSWNLDGIKGKTSDYEARYQQAILECQKVIRKMADENRSQYGSSMMSGYSAHTKPGQYAGLLLNGSRGNDCEDFIMREHLKQNGTSEFCKTNRAAYGDAVICSLLILHYRLGDILTVNSDGDAEDWQPWADYVSKILRRKVKVPDTIRNYNTRNLKQA